LLERLKKSGFLGILQTLPFGWTGGVLSNVQRNTCTVSKNESRQPAQLAGYYLRKRKKRENELRSRKGKGDEAFFLSCGYNSFARHTLLSRQIRQHRLQISAAAYCFPLVFVAFAAKVKATRHVSFLVSSLLKLCFSDAVPESWRPSRTSQLVFAEICASASLKCYQNSSPKWKRLENAD